MFFIFLVHFLLSSILAHNFCVARLDSGYDKAPLIKKKKNFLCTFFKQRNWLVDMIFWDIWLVDQTRDSPFMTRDPSFMQVLGTQLLWKGTHLLCKGLTFYEKEPTFYASSLQGTQLLWKGTHLLCKFSWTSPLSCLQVLGTQLLWKGTHLLCKGLTFYEEGPNFYDHRQ